jgi:hypothetical protein
MRRNVLPIWVATSALVLSGCGDNGDDLPRRAVAGRVVVDGQPLDAGEIVFVPRGGEGPSAGGKIENGSYSIRRADGPLAGPHDVSISSSRPTGKKIKDEVDPNVTYDERIETIPEKYNSATELKADVASGGSNRFDFTLTGRKDPARAGK